MHVTLNVFFFTCVVQTPGRLSIRKAARNSIDSMSCVTASLYAGGLLCGKAFLQNNSQLSI